MVINRLTIKTLVCFSLLIAAVVGYNDYFDYNKLTFVLDMESSRPGRSQVFYDVGRGFNELDSFSLIVKSGKFRRYTFPMSGKNIKSIRFDPINASSIIRIKGVMIENKHGDIVKNIPLSDFEPIQQIAKMDNQKEVLFISVIENAKDPIIQIKNSSINRQIHWKEYLVERGWVIIVYGVLILLIMTGLNYFAVFSACHEKFTNNILRHREAVLMGLLGFWSVIILLLTPPFQVPDEFAHYNRAFQVSEFTMMPVKQQDLLGGALPQILKFDQAKFNFLPFFSERKLSFNQYLTMREESPAMTPESLKKREFYDFANVALYPPVPYLFSGLGIAVARLFSMTVLNGFYMARLFNLLAAIGLICYAIQLLRRLPELQLMLFLIAGMPMMTFELMSLGADCITFSLAALVLACVVSLSLQWNRRVYLILIISCVLLGLCKQTYALLPCISFVFWSSIPGSFLGKTRHIILVIACAIVPMIVWSDYAQHIYVPHRKDVHIDPIAQMRFFVNNWNILIPYFIKDIFYENLRVYSHTMYGLLGWHDTPLPRSDSAFYICLCFASVLISFKRKSSSTKLEPENYDGLVLSFAARFWLLTVVLISVLLIALSQYLSWSPVGSISLEGISGRYFIPLLPVILLAFYRLLPIRLKEPFYLSWAVFSLGAWAYFSWQTASILRVRYWIA